MSNYLNSAQYVLANFSQVLLESIGILVAQYLEQFLQLTTDILYLRHGARVEEDFLQEVIVLVHHSLGNGHVLLEGGTGSILMFHDSSKDESGNERDRQ